jgi:translation initiation factor 2 subunit 2
MKKKKKKGKKGGFDLEAFEKELGESANTNGEDETGGKGKDGENDEAADLGDDPFANDEDQEGGNGKDSIEAWQGTDRDYTYQEVSGSTFV